MPLNTTYKQIFAISAPIMLGSAVQNLLALTDSIFLYHLTEVDFAAIGFVGVFYLVIAAIGYGFSKGGQIIIARRMGEANPERVGRAFYAMLYFELMLAVAMFLFMYFGASWFFSAIVNSQAVYDKSLEYLGMRSWGVFASYTGVAIIALYTGVARTRFIMYDTVLLAVVNIVLNYSLIFGHFGLPAMGIAGAGLASTIAEYTALAAFVLYILGDSQARSYHLFRLPDIDWKLIKNLFRLSVPMVAQAIVGLGSWFLFFGFIENMGERPLAISNLGRIVYLVLSIPSWGYAAGVNTLVSSFIGMNKRQAVVPIIRKTAGLCWFTTIALALPVAAFPETLLYPLFGGTDMSLITEARPLLWLLVLILSLFSIGGVFFNGLAGTGATMTGLKLQATCAVGYLIYTWLVVEYWHLGLLWAWAAEVWYWLVIIAVSLWFLKSKQWYRLRF